MSSSARYREGTRAGGGFKWTVEVEHELLERLLECSRPGDLQTVFAAMATKHEIGFVEEHSLGSNGDPVARKWWGWLVNDGAYKKSLLPRTSRGFSPATPAEVIAINQAYRCGTAATRPEECRNPPTVVYIARLLYRPESWVAANWMSAEDRKKHENGMKGFGLKKKKE